VKLVVADDHKGLRAAATKVLHATQQRCRVHWMRNLLGRVPPGQRAMVAALLRTIFAQDTAEAAHEQWRKVADSLRERFAKVAELMDSAEHDVLAHRAFPKEHWPQLASTNPLERLNGEIKRRANVVGIFPNSGAAARLIGATLLEQTDAWAVARRYMSLETIRPGGDADTLVSLPAVVG
jgi:putative transposase